MKHLTKEEEKEIVDYLAGTHGCDSDIKEEYEIKQGQINDIMSRHGYDKDRFGVWDTDKATTRRAEYQERNHFFTEEDLRDDS